MTRLDAILVELRRRKVFRAAAAYGLVAFAVLQVAEPVMHGLALPDWILTAVVVLLGLGFPAALVLAWLFDVGPGGVERTPSSDLGPATPSPRPGTPVEAVEPLPGAALPRLPPPRLRPWAVKPSRAALVALAAAALGIAGWRWWARPQSPAGPRITVAVADFTNQTDDGELDGLSGLLITSLEQSRRLSVLTRSRMLDELRLLGRGDAEGIDEATGREVARRTGARALITASVHHFDTVYTVDLKALDPVTSEYLFTLKEVARGKSSLPALIDRLSEQAREALREGGPDVRSTRIEVGRAVTSSLEAYGHYFRGEQRKNLGLYDEAIAEYEQAIAADPDFALAHLGIAYLGDFWGVPPERQRRALQEAVRAAPRLPEKERLLVLAWQAVQEDRPEAARSTYARAVEEFAPDKEVLYLAADQLHHLGELEAAAPLFTRALDLDPGFLPAADHLTAELGVLGRLDEALSVAERAARADPQGSYLVARVRKARGESREELEVLERRALAGAPEDLMALVDELNLAGERHRAAEALRRLEAAATTPAWQVELWHVRAKAAALAGRVREAVELARRALEVPGASFGSQNHARGFLLVMAAGRQGGLDAERGLLDALVKDSGRAAGVGVMLAWAGSGEASATRMMPRGLRRVVVAIARWRAGDPDSAIAELQRFGLEADRLPLWLLGEVQLERGRPREAAAALEAFLRSGAEAWTAPRSLARLAQARAALGDRPGARAALDRYFRLLDRPDPDLPLLAEARSLRASLAGVQ